MRVPNERVVFVLEDVDAASGAVRRRGPLQGGLVDSAEPGAAPVGDGGYQEPPEDWSGYYDDRDRRPVAGPLRAQCQRPKAPALTLSGLLNVLDGIQDSPGRIVVMTTNHREHLDPALIRPGRVTMDIRMGGISAEHAELMALKYFPGAGRDRIDCLAAFARERVLTPASLETLCGSKASIDEVVSALGDSLGAVGRGDRFGAASSAS